MITDKGKEILGKYMIGYAPAYASHIAIGCGAKPLETVSGQDYSAKTALDFEMLRVPIISRGYILEDNINKIVFTASLPTEERYEISEIGIFSAANNSLAGNRDSRNLFAFTKNESWKYFETSLSAGTTIVDRPVFTNTSTNNIDVTENVFTTTSDSSSFLSGQPRLDRYERPRFFNDVIMIVGDNSTFSGSVGSFTVDGGFIELSDISIPLDGNSPEDLIKVAFTVLDKNSVGGSNPTSIKMTIRFICAGAGDNYADLQFEASGNDNRYYVKSIALKDIVKTGTFAWSNVDTVRIYSSIDASDSYYLALDAIRLENIVDTELNPLYGLVGYTAVANTQAAAIVKNKNSSNYVEFRFALDVV